MGYVLGIDVGTSKTAAAVHDGDRSDVVELGNRSAVVPSVVFRTEAGDLLFGEAADRRGGEEPARVAREFKRRVGDQVPLLVGGTPVAAQRLMALTVQWVIGRVSELRGGPPDRIVVACPANWGPYKRTALESALAALGIEASLATEPECAAAQVSDLDSVGIGALVATYDLGGGTFDAAVLRREPDGFHVVGTPLGIESIGGADVDEAVFAHVWDVLGYEARTKVAGCATGELATLRRDVVEAKEHLSEDTQSQVMVALDGGRRAVLLQRTELEERVRPLVEETVDCLRRAVVKAGMEPGELAAVLLVGGTSRMPIVVERVAAGLGVPVVRDRRPQLAVALGAAILAVAPTAAPPTAPDPGRLEPPSRTARHRRQGRMVAGLTAAVTVALAGGVALAATGDDTTKEPAKELTMAKTTPTPVSPATSATTAPAVTQQLRVAVRGAAGLGTVRSAPQGIECSSGEPAGCMVSFPRGTVTLRAVAREGVRFLGWDGACHGSGDCRLTLTGTGVPVAVEAAFVRPARTSADDPPRKQTRPTDMVRDRPGRTETEQPDPEPTRPSFPTFTIPPTESEDPGEGGGGGGDVDG